MRMQNEATPMNQDSKFTLASKKRYGVIEL